jgi:hypothetical protein
MVRSVASSREVATNSIAMPRLDISPRVGRRRRCGQRQGDRRVLLDDDDVHEFDVSVIEI